SDLRVRTEVVEVAGAEAGRLLANHLVQPNPDGIPTLTGLRPQAVERLRAAGWAPPSPPAAPPALGWVGPRWPRCPWVRWPGSGCSSSAWGSPAPARSRPTGA